MTYPPLFKYCRNQSQNEYLLDIFKNSRLHLTAHTKLNDIFDCRINLSASSMLDKVTERSDHFINYKNTINPNISLDEYKKIQEVDLQDRERMNWTFNEMYNDVPFGVTCFSKTNKNDILWAYYTDSFKGICLEFDFNDLNNDILSEGLLKEVHYTDEYLSVKNIDDLKKLLYRKKTSYSAEQEWRITIPLLTQKPEYFKFKKSNLKSIFFGANIDKELGYEIILYTQIKGYKLNYYGMYSEYDSLDIHFKQIEVKNLNYYVNNAMKDHQLSDTKLIKEIYKDWKKDFESKAENKKYFTTTMKK
jgi:hypothetical protein